MSGVGGEPPNTSNVRSTFGRSIAINGGSVQGSNSQSSSNANYSVAKPPIALPLQKNSKKGKGSYSSSRSHQNDEEDNVENIIEEVFRDPENSDKIKRNLAILKESRLKKLFVTFNGRDVKAPAKEFKDSLIATFGNIGYDVYQMMNRLIWYMIFSNMKGTFPTLTWNEHVLDKEVSRVDEKGRRHFCAPQKLIASEEQNHLVIAEELMELFSISTEYDEDEDEQDGTINVRSGKSSSSEDPIDSTDLELKEILAIFRGVSTTRTVRKAFHLLLLFNTTSYKTISKYQEIDEETKESCNGKTVPHLRKLHLTYLQHQVNEYPNVMSNIRDRAFSKDYFILLQRFNRSISYHIVDYLKSVHKYLIGGWDKGDGRGCSLWGIHPRNRPFMLLHAHECVGYTAPDDNKEMNDQLCPLPHMNIEFLELLVAEGSISAERVIFEKEVRDDTLRSVEELMDRIYEDSTMTEEGEWTLVDTTTPAFYNPLQQDSQQCALLDPHTFVKYWQCELKLLTAVGIGALMDNKHKSTNSQPPYTLQNLVTRCYDDSKVVNTSSQVVRLSIYRKGKLPDNAPPSTIPLGNGSMIKSPTTYYPIDRSIFFSFLYEVQKMIHLKNFKELNKDLLAKDIICPSIVDIERGLYDENINQIFGVSRNRETRMRKLEKHPMIMLMQLCVWNEKICCVPLNDLNGFEEFFELYSLEFLARILSLMLVAAQFPCSPLWKEIDDVSPSATTRIHTRLFDSQTIHPNIVTAIYKLLQIDKQSILKYLPLWEQQYILRVLCILVPKEKYNLPGFGMFLDDHGDDDNDDIDNSNRKGGKNSVHGKRRTEKQGGGNIGNKKAKTSLLSNQVTIADEYSGGNVTTNQGMGIGNNNRGRGRPKLTEEEKQARKDARDSSRLGNSDNEDEASSFDSNENDEEDVVYQEDEVDEDEEDEEDEEDRGNTNRGIGAKKSTSSKYSKEVYEEDDGEVETSIVIGDIGQNISKSYAERQRCRREQGIVQGVEASTSSSSNGDSNSLLTTIVNDVTSDLQGTRSNSEISSELLIPITTTTDTADVNQATTNAVTESTTASNATIAIPAPVTKQSKTKQPKLPLTSSSSSSSSSSGRTKIPTATPFIEETMTPSKDKAGKKKTAKNKKGK